MDEKWREMFLAGVAADEAQIEAEAADLTAFQISYGLHRTTQKSARAKEILAIAEAAALDLSNARLIEAELEGQLRVVREKIRIAEKRASKLEDARRLAAETQRTADTLAEALRTATETAASAAQRAAEAGERFAGVAGSTLGGYRAKERRREPWQRQK